jgi:hypothetical protein
MARRGVCKTKRNPPLGEGLVLSAHNCSFDLSSHAFAEVNAPETCVYLFKPHPEGTKDVEVELVDP